MTASPNSSWFALARDALLLKPEPYQRLSSGPPSLRRAIMIVAVVGLIIGAVNALVGIPFLVQGPSFNSDEFVRQIEEQMLPWRTFSMPESPETEEFLDMYLGNIRAFAPYVEKIMDVPAPLPDFAGRFLQWIGAWLSTPFALLAKWLFLSIWIMLFARLLGGRGNLLPFLSASALSVLPHTLHAFDFIPCLNVLIWLVAGIWGLAMQVKAVEITHGLSQGRAILATVSLYILLLLLMGFVFMVSFIALIIAASG